MTVVRRVNRGVRRIYRRVAVTSLTRDTHVHSQGEAMQRLGNIFTEEIG